MPHGVIEEDAGVPNVPPFQANQYYTAAYVVQQGGLLYARTTSGISGASFAADAANWTALGSSSELGYTEVTSSQPPSPFINNQNTFIAIPGYSVTVTTGSRPILVEANVIVQQVTTTNPTTTTITILEDGVDVGPEASVSTYGQFNSQTPSVRVRRNPTPGSHTYALYGKVGAAAATAWCVASTTQPGFIRVTQA